MKTLFFIFVLIILSSLLYSTIINVYAGQSIQTGIDAAANTDTVLVQPGTYVENINYIGKLITVGSLFLTTQDTTHISSTIIDGNSNGSVVTFENSEDSSAVLSGFTITNGFTTNGGGGIYCHNASPNLQNVIITGNDAYDGSGIYCSGSNNPSLQHVTISGNTAVQRGGGIYFQYSSPGLKDVTITGNSATAGGGVYCKYIGSNPIFESTTISGNSATAQGGGIYCYQSPDLILQNVTISNNTTAGSGGGIYLNTSDPVLRNSILWNNSPDEINSYWSTDSVTVTYSDIQGGWVGIGNIDINPLFTDPGNGDYHLTWVNFPIPDATMSPCIDTGDPSSLFDPDGTITDMGAYYFDKSPGAPEITAVMDVPNDQGRYVQVIWNRSPYDPVAIGSYSIWRYDDVYGDRGLPEIYNNPVEIFGKAAEDDSKQYYWQRDNEILAFITQLPAMGFSQYSIIAPTLKDSSIVSINYSAFKVFAHTELTAVYFPSLPDSGYSVDNIAPDETEVYITQNGSNMNLIWDEVEYGTYQGNSYPEINGICYKIYAGNSPDFTCDEAHLIDTVTNLNYNYPIAGEEKKFFKITVSDQP